MLAPLAALLRGLLRLNKYPVTHQLDSVHRMASQQISQLAARFVHVLDMIESIENEQDLPPGACTRDTHAQSKA